MPLIVMPHGQLRGKQEHRMRVLVSNDDGVDAPGIRILAAGPARRRP